MQSFMGTCTRNDSRPTAAQRGLEARQPDHTRPDCFIRTVGVHSGGFPSLGHRDRFAPIGLAMIDYFVYPAVYIDGISNLETNRQVEQGEKTFRHRRNATQPRETRSMVDLFRDSGAEIPHFGRIDSVAVERPDWVINALGPSREP